MFYKPPAAQTGPQACICSAGWMMTGLLAAGRSPVRTCWLRYHLSVQFTERCDDNQDVIELAEQQNERERDDILQQPEGEAAFPQLPVYKHRRCGWVWTGSVIVSDPNIL